MHFDNKVPLIDFRNVTVALREKKMLDAFSLQIHHNENVAILGPNGSGKSTFIKAVTREYYPLAGEDVVFRVRGKDVWNIFDLRSQLGIVAGDLQEECRQPVTAFETVLSGFFSSIGLFNNHHVTARMRETAAAVLEHLEIAHLAGVAMNAMSSGEARRVLIGRALVHDPAALILDEPTNSLDLHALARFRDIMRKIARSGKNIILVTHNLHDIIPEITRVVLVKNGRVFKDGRKEDILTDPVLSELFMMPIHTALKDNYYHAW